jgi:hypothetical protein
MVGKNIAGVFDFYPRCSGHFTVGNAFELKKDTVRVDLLGGPGLPAGFAAERVIIPVFL